MKKSIALALRYPNRRSRAITACSLRSLRGDSTRLALGLYLISESKRQIKSRRLQYNDEGFAGGDSLLATNQPNPTHPISASTACETKVSCVSFRYLLLSHCEARPMAMARFSFAR